MQDDMTRNETVASRPHPELDAQGILFGGFTLFPQVAIDDTLNDNIYATNTNPIADVVSTVTSQAYIRSHWDNDQYSVKVNNASAFYADHPSENFVDYTVIANGRQDATRDAYIAEQLGYLKQHDDRGSPDDVYGKTPTDWTDRQGSLHVFDTFNRLSLGIEASADRYDYDNVESSLNTPIDNTVRDRTEYDGGVRVGYRLVSEFEAFLHLFGSDIRYDRKFDDSGFQRSSIGYGVDSGVTLDLGGITFGDIGAGYLAQRYDDPRYGTVSGPHVQVGLTWNATPLMTVKVTMARTLQQTVVVDSPGYIASSVGLTLDHELLRSLILSTMLAEQQNDYQHVGRRDSVFSASFGGTYRMSQGLALTLKLSRKEQASTSSTYDFTQNILQIKLSLQR